MVVDWLEQLVMIADWLERSPCTTELTGLIILLVP